MVRGASVSVELLLDTRKFQNEWAKTHTRIQAIPKMFTNIKWVPGLFKSMGVAMGQAAAFAARLVTSFAKLAAVAAGAATGLAAFAATYADKLEIAQMKFDTVFGTLTSRANNVAREIADALGRNVGTIQSAMARIGDIVQPMGIAEDQALRMSETFTVLGNAASIWTEGQYDARTATIALTKALVGEREMLKELGVVIQEERDINKFLKENNLALSTRNKAIRTFNLILERSPFIRDLVQSGKFMDTLIYKISQITDAWKDFSKGLGTLVRPIAVEVVELFNTVLSKLGEIMGSDGFAGVRDAAEGVARVIRSLSGAIRNIDVGNLRQDLQNIWAEYMPRIREIMSATHSFLVDIFIELGKMLADIIAKGVAEGGIKGLAMASEAPSGAARNILEGMSINFANTQKSAFAEAADNFANRIRQVWEDLPDTTRPGSERAAEALRSEGGYERVTSRELFERNKSRWESINRERERLGDSISETRKRIREASQKDIRASLVGVEDFYSTLLQQAAGRTKPDMQVARNTRKLIQLQEDKKEVDKKLKDLLEKIFGSTKDTAKAVEKLDTRSRYG